MIGGGISMLSIPYGAIEKRVYLQAERGHVTTKYFRAPTGMSTNDSLSRVLSLTFG
jgi:hypothetical protein